MANILRTTAVWTGFVGGPGYTNHYWDSAIIAGPSAQIAADKVRTFFDAIKGSLPLGVNVQVQPVVAEINDATGQQVNEYTLGTPPLIVAAGGTAARSAPSGASVNWRTTTFVNGKRLRGRTFLVPLSNGAYDTDGTLTAATLTTLVGAAATLCNNAIGPSVLMKVWHRPVGGQGGSSANITSSSVTDKVAVLTSRR